MAATEIGELERVWLRHGQERPGAVDNNAGDEPASAPGCLYAALLYRARGDHDRARAYAARAAETDPKNVLCHQLLAYLDSESGISVYAGGEAFAAFIRGGGNRLLYQRLGAALWRAHGPGDAMRLLDIGVGDGLALLSALDEHGHGEMHDHGHPDSRGHDRPALHLDLIEPSAPMLARVCAALDRRGLSYSAHATTLESFAGNARGHWDVAQATFSLQCIAPARRAPLLAWVREHTDALLIAEFDTPLFAQARGPERAEFLLRKYQAGVSEYTGDQDLVAQGFLMPFLLSVFTGSGDNNHEQPISAWQDECRAAGFTRVRADMLCEYWWGDAYLITAQR